MGRPARPLLEGAGRGGGGGKEMACEAAVEAGWGGGGGRYWCMAGCCM